MRDNDRRSYVYHRHSSARDEIAGRVMTYRIIYQIVAVIMAPFLLLAICLGCGGFMAMNSKATEKEAEARRASSPAPAPVPATSQPPAPAVPERPGPAEQQPRSDVGNGSRLAEESKRGEAEKARYGVEKARYEADLRQFEAQRKLNFAKYLAADGLKEMVRGNVREANRLTEEARKRYAEVSKRYPGTDAAADAELLLAGETPPTRPLRVAPEMPKPPEPPKPAAAKPDQASSVKVEPPAPESPPVPTPNPFVAVPPYKRDSITTVGRYLAETGDRTGTWKPEWEGSSDYFMCSPYREIGPAGWDGQRCNIAYYALGVRDAVIKLELVLNVNNPAYKREAEREFSKAAGILIFKATGHNPPTLMKESQQIGSCTVTVSREELAIKDGYTLHLRLE